MWVPRRRLYPVDRLGRYSRHRFVPFAVVHGKQGIGGNPVVVLPVDARGPEPAPQPHLVREPGLQTQGAVFTGIGGAIEIEPPVPLTMGLFPVGAPVADLVKEHLGQAVVGVEVLSG